MRRNTSDNFSIGITAILLHLISGPLWVVLMMMRMMMMMAVTMMLSSTDEERGSPQHGNRERGGMKSRGEITGDKHHSGVTLSKRKSDSDLICEEKRSLIFLPLASTKEAAGCEVEEGALAHVPQRHFCPFW